MCCTPPQEPPIGSLEPGAQSDPVYLADVVFGSPFATLGVSDIAGGSRSGFGTAGWRLGL